MENLNLYQKNEKPPQWALKTITGGRLNGKTDINPQWRYLALTETYGLCGFGWKYEVTKQWIEKGEKDEVCAFVNINLYVCVNDKWSEPIPGNGGSMFVSLEKNGLYTSDEAFKMATTDALGVACKMLGIGAAIYSGTKYEPKNNITTPEQSLELAEIIKAIKKASSKEDLALLWDSLDESEQKQTKAIFTRRKQELEK